MTYKRIAGALAATAMLAAPALASAHNGTDDHGRHHHAKQAPVRPVVGTVTAFASGQLTITVANGKSYDGLVTRHTILHCRHSAVPLPIAAPRAARHGHGDHGDAPSATTPSTTTPSTTVPPATRAGRCSTADLVAGAKVTEAKLTLTSDGAAWKKVDLLK